MSLDARQQELKQTFIETFGSWTPQWQQALILDPGFFKAYLDLASVPHRKQHLDAKTREFVSIAVNAAATHLSSAGVKRHIRAAQIAGATPAEVMEVLQCTSTLSIHAMNVGVPVLVDVLAERGIRTEAAPLNEYQERLKAEFTEKRGYWNSTWDEMLELDPELFEAYTNYSSYPWEHGTLSPKTREFIYIAFDVSATHLYKVGLKLHIENALDYGATVGELLEIMELASQIGMESVLLGSSFLVEEDPGETVQRA